MTNDEIMQLLSLNYKRYEAVKILLYDQYMKQDEYLMDQYKKNAKHQHFKTRDEMYTAMAADCNPYNTFSSDEKPPLEPINIEHLATASKSCPNGCDPDETMWYNTTWDRFFCRPCDIWLEKNCSCIPTDNIKDLKCYFRCWNCPPKPSEAFCYE